MRVAVIGHGCSPVGKAWGKYIDECDNVFRLWDCAWQDKRDYGVRYDYGYYTAHKSYINTMRTHNKRTPRKAWVGQEINKDTKPKYLALERMPATTPSHVVHEDRWLGIGKEMGGMGNEGRFHLSRGCFLACWAVEFAGKGSTVILVGFDNIRVRHTLPLELAFPKAFREKSPGTLSFTSYGGQGTKDGPHDFAVEGRIIEEVARQHGVHLIHAQDIWSKPFVVVGHGRSPEGKGWARRIDRAHLVVRMWDCHWQSVEDYGTKYDIGFLEAHSTMVTRFHQYNRGEPSIGWIASSYDGTHDESSLPDATEVINPSEWCRRGRKMGGLGATGRLELTRGAIAACWMVTHCDAGQEVVLVGFDNLRAGVCLEVERGFPSEYRNERSTYSFAGYAPGRTKHGNHDIAIEGPLIQAIAKEHGVLVCHAVDVWG